MDRKHLHLVAVFLAVMLDFADCQGVPKGLPEEHEISYFTRLRLPGVSPNLSFDLALGEDVFRIPSLLSENLPLKLHLVYDRHYKDALHSLRKISTNLKGLTIMDYDETVKIWSHILKSIDDKPMIILLCSSYHILETFQMMKDKKLRSMEAKWLIFLRSSEEEDWLLRKMDGLVLEGTKVVLLSRIFSRIFKISTSRIDRGGVTRFQDQGMFNIDKIGNPLSTIYIEDNRSVYLDMNGRIMRVVFSRALPFTETKTISSDGSIEYYGLEFTMLDVASYKFNITYDVTVINGWGDLLPDGTGTGMIGMVYRREVDFAFSCITVTRSRSKAVDFTFPYCVDSLSILSVAPSIKNPTFITFSPFTLEVWLCIVAATTTVGPILKLLSDVMHTYHLTLESAGSLQFVSFNIFRVIVVQGYSRKVKTWSQRSLLSFWYLFCMVVAAVYSGTLISMLAIPSYEKPIDSLLDLPVSVSEGYTVAIRGNTMQESLFKNAKDGIYRDTWSLLNHDDLTQSLLPVDDASSFGMILKKKLALIDSRITNTAKAIQRGRSRYHISRESFFNKWLAWACVQGAPFKEPFNLLIFHLTEAGLVDKWIREEFEKLTTSEVNNEGSRQQAIKLIHLQGAFYLLVIGILVSTTVFIMEKVIKIIPCLTY